MPNSDDIQASRSDTGHVEPYKLSEIFSVIPEYDGNQIFLQTFLNAVRCANSMAIGNQRILLTLHVKNKLRGKAAELINSRNPSTWEEIKILLETHFGDSRDLTSLIQDLQRISQQSNESALNFVSRLQTHNAKMHASVQKTQLTAEQKTAQSNLIETMTLNTLLTGLDPKLGSIIRASNPSTMLAAISRIKRELQLSYFESQKFPKNNKPNMNFKPTSTPNNVRKSCNYCKRTGHSTDECRARQQNNNYPSQFQNFARTNFQPSNFQQPTNFNQNQNRPQINQNFQRPANQNFSQTRPTNPNFPQNNFQQNRPSAIRPNPNFQNQQRPPVIRSNPNFNQPRAHHVNAYNNEYFDDTAHQYSSDQYYYDQNNYDEYYDYSNDPNQYDYTDVDNTAYQQYEQSNYDDTAHQFETFNENNYPNSDFPDTSNQNHPPNQQTTEILTLQNQVQTLSLNEEQKSKEQCFL
ncbi:hypothetical protein NQ317_004049 [Molorchus minor]|uniref:Gag protein n=1 Tax=Molorchus minor TaxID=1323400 RepID=A0ABQ9IWL7_9CUCU|nr:hypothetical protein NQ317_004049 [Molorchus minor]